LQSPHRSRISADSLPLLEAGPSAGLPLTAETCPHYLYFALKKFRMATPGSNARADPRRDNRERVWNGLKQARSTLSSPIIRPESRPEMFETGDFQKAWGGISSLQLGLPVVWTEASKRGFSIGNVAAWMCERAGAVCRAGKKKGKIASGYDADLIVWNPEEKFRVKTSELFHRHKMNSLRRKTLRALCGKPFSGKGLRKKFVVGEALDRSF